MKKAKSINQCVNCFREVNPLRSKRLCEYCLEKKREYDHAHKEARLKSQQKRKELVKLCPSFGICSHCLKRPSEESKKWCSVCLEKKRIHDKKIYARFTEQDKIKKNQKQRERRQRNLEQYREAGRKYYRLHPEKYAGATLKRNAVKKKAGGSFTNREWFALLKEHGGKCLWCGTTRNIHKDHVTPLSRGGTNYISNIQPLCEYCNKKKMKKIIDFRPFGSIILDWT